MLRALNLQLDKAVWQKACLMIKCWISHVIHWISFWEWKTMFLWVENDYKYIDCLPSWSHSWLEAVTCYWCPKSGENTVLHIANVGKKSKFKILFSLNAYCFCSLQHHKVKKILNHNKSRSCLCVCVWYVNVLWYVITILYILSLSLYKRGNSYIGW